ncbi:hypothetical protein [Methanoculleus sp.]|uniref:hypothetical protein n=1 Tax=Methanoculleus sp. TaxID=90427 RepID=UPI001BD33311|nr:hypothetical protein [Methanoculleus sp.]
MLKLLPFRQSHPAARRSSPAFSASPPSSARSRASNSLLEDLRSSPAPAQRASRDYYATFTRKTVRISSYRDDAVRDAVETRTDAVPALN